LEDHLSRKESRTKSSGEEVDEEEVGPYIVGNGKQFTLLDCSLAPKLYALDVCLTEVKGWSMDELKARCPHLRNYMDALFERPSFQKTVEYGKETVVWGWTSDH
jgi:glutathione S-transferase